MEIQEGVRTWLLAQKDWLQEAAERLLKQGQLQASDFSALAALLKSPQGRQVTKHRTFDELTIAEGSSRELRLCSIQEVYGIESLGPRDALVFGTGNLAVVYGHNGSGKSSYTRVLKKISGKPRAADLKPNVFKAAPAEQKCRITYQIGGIEADQEWHLGSPAIDDLRTLDVFDGSEAAFYLSGESTVTYVPSIVGLFEKLAAACETVKAILENEQSHLICALPSLPGQFFETPSASLYRSLGSQSQAAVESLLQWSEADALQLKHLDERLRVDDPAAIAKRKRANKAEVQQIISSIVQAVEVFGGQSLDSIRQLRSAAYSKRQIAREGARVQAAILEGVGTPTWRAMWEAAREYSATPYPHAPFPVTDNARCLLCHQELSVEAQNRLKDFESFVHSKLEADASAAELAYKTALQQLPSLPTEAQIQSQCAAAGLLDDWKAAIWSFWLHASQTKQNLLTHEEQPAIATQDFSENIARLSAYRDALETQATQHDADAQQFDRAQAAREKLGLEAKQWIAEQAAHVTAEIKRLREIADLEACKALTNTRALSVKSAEVTQKVVTNAYVQRFNNELKLLGASRIQVELVKSRTRNAQVYHQLRLKGITSAEKPDGILSDGERRIISLAAFLADVAEKPGSAPFVFDDPISSLDHDFEWSVACRLVELAKERQVIVFTHRLSLYGALEDAADQVDQEWRKTHYLPMCIEAYGGAAGHPVPQDTWTAKTKAANNILLERLSRAKKAGEADGGAAYRALAQGICCDFRKLLERSVEEDLFNKVVLRHRRSVTTDGRLRDVDITEEDCRFFDNLMGKYSGYLHSQSAEAPAFLPDEPELRADIEGLKRWRDGLANRRKKA